MTSSDRGVSSVCCVVAPSYAEDWRGSMTRVEEEVVVVEVSSPGAYVLGSMITCSFK